MIFERGGIRLVRQIPVARRRHNTNRLARWSAVWSSRCGRERASAAVWASIHWPWG